MRLSSPVVAVIALLMPPAVLTLWIKAFADTGDWPILAVALLSSLVPGVVAIGMWNRRGMLRLIVALAYVPLGLAALSMFGLMTVCDLNRAACVH